MTIDSIWDDPEMFPSGDYITFDKVGDTVTGTITAIRRHMFDDGKIAPQLGLDTTDGPRTLTAGQIRLKTALATARPNIGDLLTVTLTAIVKRPGGKTLKEFDVVVGQAPPTPTGPPKSVDSLTPEQMAAIQALL
jgi:hypothetical protein